MLQRRNVSAACLGSSIVEKKQQVMDAIATAEAPSSQPVTIHSSPAQNTARLVEQAENNSMP